MSGKRIRGWVCDACPWDMIAPGRYLRCPNCTEPVRVTTLKEVTDRRQDRQVRKERRG